MSINKAMVESYLRNLLGVVLALVASATATAGVASPFDLGAGEWLTVLNGVWAAAVPTLIRFFNAKDAAFGKMAEVVAAEVSKKIEAEAKKAAPVKKPTATRKTSPGPGKGGGGGTGPVAR